MSIYSRGLGRPPGYVRPWDDFRSWRSSYGPRWFPVRLERPALRFTPPFFPSGRFPWGMEGRYERRRWLEDRWWDCRRVPERERMASRQENDTSDLQRKASGILDAALADMSVKVVAQPLHPEPRPKGLATPLSRAITSEVYFTKDAWQKILAEHGIIINDKARDPDERLVIKAEGVRVSLAYRLSDDDLQKILAAKVSGKDGVSMEERIRILNAAIGHDFQEKITLQHLESKDYISIRMKEECQKEAERCFAEQDRQARLEQARLAEKDRREKEDLRIRFDRHAENGRELALFMPGMMFRAPVMHGREVFVGEIRADRRADGKYVMTAEINGQRISREITEARYHQFIQQDAKKRFGIFENVFRDMVAIKHGTVTKVGSSVYMDRNGNIYTEEQLANMTARSGRTDGRELQYANDKKAFYREGTHRQQEIDVRDIAAQQDREGKYKLTAVVDGHRLSYDITEKQFARFQAMDDYHRMKLLAKVAPDIELRTRPGRGFNAGAFLAAGAVAGLEMVAGISMMRNRPAPAVFVESHGPAVPAYGKPGVIHPQEVADRIFAQHVEQNDIGEGMGRGR